MYLHPTYAVTPPREPPGITDAWMWARQLDMPDGSGGILNVTCMVIRKRNAPAGVNPVEWCLLTNREVNDFTTAVELIDWYRCRWEIEIFFKALKNGCRIEALQLGSVAKLELRGPCIW